jgi:hypothetical protein
MVVKNGLIRRRAYTYVDVFMIFALRLATTFPKVSYYKQNDSFWDDSMIPFDLIQRDGRLVVLVRLLWCTWILYNYIILCIAS